MLTMLLATAALFPELVTCVPLLPHVKYGILPHKSGAFALWHFAILDDFGTHLVILDTLKFLEHESCSAIGTDHILVV